MTISPPRETAAREVYDVTGAGDTVIAALAVGLAAGASLIEAAMFATKRWNRCGKVGTATAVPLTANGLWQLNR